MAFIARRGSVPSTPHTEFFFLPGVLALEEIHGSYGFSGPWSRKMHVRSYPTEQVAAPKTASFSFEASLPKEGDVLQPYLLHTIDMPFAGDALRSRKAIIVGESTRWSVVKAVSSFGANEFFRNGENHELYFVQEGSGVLSTEFGTIPLRKNLYVVVPKGTTYRIDLSSPQAFLLLIEAKKPIEFPPHYMNHGGQAHLTSPVVETEIELPELSDPKDERGEFSIFIQHQRGKITHCVSGHHPHDVCGWEGSFYPFGFDIHNHHGIAREMHTAPPMHQTFQSGNVPYDGFSVCSFVPQVEGWHPKDVPAPYAHFNVDSDEVMFFCNTSYGARETVLKEGSITFHPGSVPHSPHGTAARDSLGARGKFSQRLAVMMDTCFESMQITDYGYKYADKNYSKSWSEA